MNIIKEGQEGKGLIIESDGYFDPSYEKNKFILNEAKENAKTALINPYIYVILQRFGAENRNKRVYPEAVLKKAVEEYQFHIKGRSALGAVDHEDSTNVSLRKDSLGLLLEEAYWEGNALIGKVYLPITRAYRAQGIVSTEVDHIANLIFEHNIRIGISSRGIGQVKKQGDLSIVTEYNLLCWDWVQMPSTHDSWAMKEESEALALVKTQSIVQPVKTSKFDRLMDMVGR